MNQKAVAIAIVEYALRREESDVGSFGSQFNRESAERRRLRTGTGIARIEGRSNRSLRGRIPGEDEGPIVKRWIRPGHECESKAREYAVSNGQDKRLTQRSYGQVGTRILLKVNAASVSSDGEGGRVDDRSEEARED